MSKTGENIATINVIVIINISLHNNRYTLYLLVLFIINLTNLTNRHT